MKTLNKYFHEQMKNEQFAKAYADIQPEMTVIRAIVEARASKNLTQKELSERTGIAQTEISKLENGTRNPSVKLLQRLAEGMDMDFMITFVPKNEPNRQTQELTEEITKRRNIEVAINLIEEGISSETIAKATGRSIDKVAELAKAV